MIDSIENLFELGCRCEAADADFWQCIAIGAAQDLPCRVAWTR